MRLISFDFEAFEQYGSWALENRRMLVRIQRLIIETSKNPFDGIGKPKSLRGNFKGYWSRRINDEHRLVYKVTDTQIIIVACKYHYE